jgi:predicted Zn-ribbon and HTH transcriptional regulator
MTAPAFRRTRLAALVCTCQRCDHVWTVVGTEPPARCGHCKSPYWQTKAGVLPRGRPKRCR